MYCEVSHCFKDYNYDDKAVQNSLGSHGENSKTDEPPLRNVVSNGSADAARISTNRITEIYLGRGFGTGQ